MGASTSGVRESMICPEICMSSARGTASVWKPSFTRRKNSPAYSDTTIV